jgi:protein-S-isoprenylcysteine O-methyltransferase Ste14
LPFATPWLYQHVRHPLYVGWAFAFWAIPTMTLGHLVFAAGMTTYILLAVMVEERDLLAHFGSSYAEYRRRVPMFVPRLFRSAGKMQEVADHGSTVALRVARNGK